MRFLFPNPYRHLVTDQAFFGALALSEAVKENLGGGVLLTPSNPDRF